MELKREQRSLLREVNVATYVDIGIGAIFLIAIIVGIIRGFAKQFSSGFCGFIGLIGSIGLTLIIMPALQSAGTLSGFASSATGWFSGEAFTTAVAGEEELIAVMSNGFLRILTSLSSRIWTAMETNGMSTLGEYFGDMCARLITGIVIWIVLLLAIKFIFLGIKKLLEKLSKLPVLRTLDRIFGGIWSLLIAYVVVISLITTALEIVIVKWLPNLQATLEEIVSNSTVFQVLHDTNIIGSYIARLLGVDLATLSPIV